MATIITITRSAALALSLTLLSACGNKGPLFIPEAPAEPQSQNQTQVPAQEQSQNQARELTAD